MPAMPQELELLWKIKKQAYVLCQVVFTRKLEQIAWSLKLE